MSLMSMSQSMSVEWATQLRAILVFAFAGTFLVNFFNPKVPGVQNQLLSLGLAILSTTYYIIDIRSWDIDPILMQGATFYAVAYAFSFFLHPIRFAYHKRHENAVPWLTGLKLLEISMLAGLALALAFAFLGVLSLLGEAWPVAVAVIFASSPFLALALTVLARSPRKLATDGLEADSPNLEKGKTLNPKAKIAAGCALSIAGSALWIAALAWTFRLSVWVSTGYHWAEHNTVYQVADWALPGGHLTFAGVVARQLAVQEGYPVVYVGSLVIGGMLIARGIKKIRGSRAISAN